MYNVYSRKSCYPGGNEKEKIGSYETLSEAWQCIKKHYGKEIYYTRTIMAKPNEYIYDVSSHTQFYSIENTEGDMTL